MNRAVHTQYRITEQIGQNGRHTVWHTEGGLLICVHLTMVGFVLHVCRHNDWNLLQQKHSKHADPLTHTRSHIHKHKHVGVEATAEVTASMFSRPSLSAWTECHSNPSLLSLHLSLLCNWSDTHWERNTLIAWFIQSPFLLRRRFSKSAFSSACCCNSIQMTDLKEC